MALEATGHQLDAAIAAQQLTEELDKARAELSSRDKLLKSVTNQLSQQTAQLNVILDNTLAGILLIDEDHYVVRANQFAEKIFGFEAGGLFGAAATDLINAPIIEVLTKAVIENGQDIESRCEEYCGIRPDGSVFPTEISISDILIKDRNHTVWFVRDISERKRREAERDRLEQELRQAQKLESLGTLASGIAHEINTPIQFIGDNLLFLQDSFRTLLEATDAAEGDLPADATDAVAEPEDGDDLEFLKEEIPTAISQSLDGVSRVSEIVSSVRDFSHPGNKERTFIDINKAVTSTVTISRNQWKYIAKLETDLDPDLPQVRGQPGEINQALLNLIVNAAQAIEERGTTDGLIRVTTRSNDAWVSICVADNGCGVPDEIKAQIFDPFFTTKDVGKGTGQGLTLAHSVIVQKHGGNIRFDKAPSGGTIFVIDLPRPKQTCADEVARGE